MKTMINFKNVALASMLFFNINSNAQSKTSSMNTGPKAAVLTMDAVNIPYNDVSMGNMLRLELEKTGMFEVMDKYDVAYMAKQNNLALENCYGKICLVDLGKSLKTNKMVTGGAESYGEQIIITLRMIDVATESIEKTQVVEFLNLPKEMQTMVSITLKKMLGIAVDEALLTTLTKKNNFENSVNMPNKDRLRLDGPRMGLQIPFGKAASIIKAPKSKGGFDANPVMFQCGYQFEKQYLNEGNIQALVEFIPMVTGLDQGLFIPSFAVLHGLRHSSGWEFGFGPNFSFLRQEYGTYVDGEFVSEQSLINSNLPTSDVSLHTSSNGAVYLNSSFVFAAGKSFKSGKLNIPVNIYVVPGKNGTRLGVSFGFNAKNRKNN